MKPRFIWRQQGTLLRGALLRVLLLLAALLLSGLLIGCTAGLNESGSSGEPSVPSAPVSTAAPSAPLETASEPETSALETPAPGLPPLHVAGTGLAGPDGLPVQLIGVSTHGLAWYPQYVNEAFFHELRTEWNADVVRLALYTAESGGYCTGGDQAQLRQLVRDGVRYAEAAGLYVIVDWHILSDGDPNRYLAEVKAFFDEMSAEFADCTHVLYEICNEPNGGVGWDTIKAYALELIPVIRQNAPDAVILVGTPTWSQEIDRAAADPITEYDNILYTLHFYAATHTDALRSRLEKALDAGLPVFVSEYGICDASGSGRIDLVQADVWLSLLDARGVSWVAWNLSNKQETSAIFRPSCDKTSGFGWEDLSASGQWVYERLTGAQMPASAPLPGQGAESTPALSEDTPPESTPPENITPESPLPEQPVILSGEGLELTLALQNSWKADGSPVYQYALTVTNVSQTTCDGWTASLPFSGPFTLLDGWNGVYTVQGSTLVITNKEYNGRLAPGAAVGDVGFILAGGGQPGAQADAAAPAQEG